MLENTSEESDEDEKEEDEVDFNNIADVTKYEKISSGGGSGGQIVKISDGNFYQKFKSKNKDKQAGKLAKKGRNRLIRSMQNLAYFRSRSRSNSADSLTSNDTKAKQKKSSPKIVDESVTSKAETNSAKSSDLIRSIFVSFSFFE